MVEEGLVSVVIPTYNSCEDLEKCLDSIRNQDYGKIEVIVVDRDSKDNTASLATEFGAKVVTTVDLRSAARNLGARVAGGEFLLFVDSDMELTRHVVSECVETSGIYSLDAVMIAEQREGQGFWADCRAFERKMYIGDPLIESARFVRVTAFRQAGGFDESMEAGEDWDLQAKLELRHFAIGKVSELIVHHEGKLTLRRLVQKRVYYGKSITKYIRRNRRRAIIQYSPVRLDYLRNYRDFVSRPLIASGFLFMKFVEYWSTFLSLLPVGFAKLSIPSEKIRPSVAAVGHVDATGPVQALEQFLVKSAADFSFVGHPFYSKRNFPSYLKHYRRGKLEAVRATAVLRGPESILYFKDFLLTVALLLRTKQRFHLYIGIDALNALAGVVLKKLGIVKTVIFYTIDLAPYRFRNPLLNGLYRSIDRAAVQHSTYVWNLSSAMEELRHELGYPTHKLAPQIVVPIGINYRENPREAADKLDRRALVYIGTLRKGQGLDLILRTFPKMMDTIPDLKLIIIGDGPLRGSMEQHIKISGISDRVQLLGFIPDHHRAEEIISKCGIGLAPYEPVDSLARYTEPSKPKTYMACGLPVIITRVPQVASDIEKAGAGIVIDYDEDQFMQAVTRLALDHNYFDLCRQNAIEFVSQYEWTKIYSEALEKCNIR